jgi:hypothetical protein
LVLNGDFEHLVPPHLPTQYDPRSRFSAVAKLGFFTNVVLSKDAKSSGIAYTGWDFWGKDMDDVGF